MFAILISFGRVSVQLFCPPVIGLFAFLSLSCVFFYILGIILYQISEVKSLSCVRFFVTPWIVAYQAPPSMGFSRQECWSGSPFPSPGDLPDPGIESGSPALQADALPSEPKCLANIYSQSIACFFVCLTVSFEKHF